MEGSKATVSKTSRAKRAERRDLVRELQEKLIRAEAECSRLALPPDQQEQLRQAAHDNAMGQLQARLSQEQEERKQLELQLKAHKQAVSHQLSLLRTDSLSVYRRKLSRYAARPVEHDSHLSAAAAVKFRWEEMDRDIELVTRQFFLFSPPWDNLAPAMQEKLLRLTPNAQRYFADDYMRLLLVQAWIWRILVETLFDKEQLPWIGEHWAAYSQLQRLAAHLATPGNAEWTVRYHIWRNLTVGMICHVTGDKSRVSPETIAKALQQEIAPLADFPGGYTLADLDELLGKIAKYAAEVDLCMHLDRTDRAVISRHPDTGALSTFPFDGDRRADGFKMAPSRFGLPMASEEKLRGQQVDLIIVPLMRQRGDGDGLAYHLPTYDLPMQVMVEWSLEENGGRRIGPRPVSQSAETPAD